MSNTNPPGNPANSKTQVNQTTPLSVDTRAATGSMQWFLEAGKDASAPVFHNNNLNYFICGEDAFKSIAGRIKRAQKSIDIVCWGFDPAMELTREAAVQWPRGETWASLLLGAATGQWTEGRPVQVRVLCWFDWIGSTDLVNNNMPGYIGWGDCLPMNAQKIQCLREWLDPAQAHTLSRGGSVADIERRQRRASANEHWYALAASGTLPSLSLRIRNGDADAIETSLRNAAPMRDEKAKLELSTTERKLLEHFGTYHQKTVLIDYDDTSPAGRPAAYVMGLNSVTDYWDTKAHVHTDPKRGVGWEGVGAGSEVNLKPLQDYATRIQGDAVVMVAKNFTEAWNTSTTGSGKNINRTCDPKAPPKHLTQNLMGTPRSIQIVRTEPKAKPQPEQTIERLYYQTTASARDYIYIENQYFQYAPWVKVLKTRREDYVKAHKSSGTAKNQIPELHLMVVCPTPERTGMVPRTHDSVKELGHGDSLPKQADRLNAEIKKYKEDMAVYERQRKQYQEQNPLSRNGIPAPTQPVLNDIARTYMDAGGGKSDEDIQDNLRKTQGLRSLVASLWTFDAKAKDKFREIYIHSKLMLADDSMFTIGSANMNARSFYGDGEINMVTDCPDMSSGLRQEVWAMHSGGGADYDGGDGSMKKLSKTFDNWVKLINLNGNAKANGWSIVGFLTPLMDERTSDTRIG